MAYECPRCGLFNTDEALRCDCGYVMSPPNERNVNRKVQAAKRELAQGLRKSPRHVVGAAFLVVFWVVSLVVAVQVGASGGEGFISIAIFCIAVTAMFMVIVLPIFLLTLVEVARRP